MNDTKIEVLGSQFAALDVGTSSGSTQLSVKAQATPSTADDILAVCKQMDAGYDVVFSSQGCRIIPQSGRDEGFVDLSHPKAIPFYRTGDRFYLDYEESKDQYEHIPRLAPIVEGERAEEMSGHQQDLWDRMLDWDPEAEAPPESEGEDNTDEDEEPQEVASERPQAPQPHEVREPSVPTQEERDRHNLLHLGTPDWCTICVSAKGKEDRHERDREGEREAEIERVELDYLFFTRGGKEVKDESRLVTCLSGGSNQIQWPLFAMVPEKGQNKFEITQVCH